MKPSASPPETVTTKNELERLRQSLSQVTSEAALEARVLLSEVMQRPTAWLLAHPEAELNVEQTVRLHELAKRRLEGTPLPYLLGHWGFFGLEFIVTPDVLIPRPETELLVEHALEWLKAHPDQQRTADIGSGSGCIAISLAHSRPGLRVRAVDCSRAALEVTRLNAARCGVETRIDLIQSDLLSALTGPFDLICANLPYIPSLSLSDLDVARHEPLLALDGGADGLTLIDKLLQSAPHCLAAGGALLLEIEAGQGESAPALAQRCLPHADVKMQLDLSGNPRLLIIQT